MHWIDNFLFAHPMILTTTDELLQRYTKHYKPVGGDKGGQANSSLLDNFSFFGIFKKAYVAVSFFCLFAIVFALISSFNGNSSNSDKKRVGERWFLYGGYIAYSITFLMLASYMSGGQLTGRKILVFGIIAAAEFLTFSLSSNSFVRAVHDYSLAEMGDLPDVQHGADDKIKNSTKLLIGTIVVLAVAMSLKTAFFH